MNHVEAATARWMVVLRLLPVLGFCLAAPPRATAAPAEPELLTNLFQLRQSAEQVTKATEVVHPFRVIAEVCDVDGAAGVLVLRDPSGVEFIRLKLDGRKLEPGATVCLAGKGCGVALDGFGLAVIPGMVVDNDGIHATKTNSGAVFLQAGPNPVSAEWFNAWGDSALTVEYEGPGLSRRTIPDSALRHATVDGATGGTNYAAGLAYLGYEGNWEKLPDFTKLRPRKTGVATNFDLNVRMCDEYTGLRFNGFIEVPQDGLYTFHLASDDGSRLFVGEPSVDVRVLADRPAPPALESAPAASPAATNQGWVTLEGTVNFASVREDAGGLQLQVGKDEVRVELFDSHGPAPDFSAHSKVRISGVYRGVNSGYGSPVQCLMQALDWRAIRSAPFAGPNPAPAMSPDAANGRAAATGRTETTRITTVAEIKVLSPELADRQLPVSIRGVVTALPGGGNIVLQDATGGIYVVLSFLQTLDKFEPPRVGELCQIDGFTVRGLFTPLVIPRQIAHLGTGLFPEPQRATREELMNGSLDTEYAEIEGVVTAVYGRQIELLMEGGPVTLELDRLRPEVLAGHEHALVQIRGCVFSPCDVQTHRLAWGTIHIGAPAVNFLQLARRDPFDTPPTSMGDLLLYKPKTAPFRWLKVSGQVLHVRDREFFLSDGTNGVHALTADSAPFSVGDRVDVAGYIELGGAVAEIREAVMRKTGHAPLPAPKKLATRQLLQAGNAGTLVAVDATLMNQWREGSEQVLELQADFLVFRARIDGRGHRIALPPTAANWP